MYLGLNSSNILILWNGRFVFYMWKCQDTKEVFRHAWRCHLVNSMTDHDTWQRCHTSACVVAVSLVLSVGLPNSPADLKLTTEINTVLSAASLHVTWHWDAFKITNSRTKSWHFQRYFWLDIHDRLRQALSWGTFPKAQQKKNRTISHTLMQQPCNEIKI